MLNSFVTLGIVAHEALLSMEFPRQEYWSGLPVPSLGNLPDPEIKPMSPALQADSLLLRYWGSPVSHLHTLLHDATLLKAISRAIKIQTLIKLNLLREINPKFFN